MSPLEVKQKADTIRKQLLSLTDFNVICSWGIEPPFVATIYKKMAALKFKVNARLHKGYVIITLNEGVDYYEIFLQKPGEEPECIADDVDFTMLGKIIDEKIETGTDIKEYERFCEEEAKRLKESLFRL